MNKFQRIQALFCRAPEIIGRCNDPEKVREGLLHIRLVKPTASDDQLQELPDDQEGALEYLSHVAIIPVPKRFGEDECNNWLAFCVAYLRMKESLQSMSLHHNELAAA